MKLVIAEKPSVAQSLSAVIGATARKDGYLEGNGWRVSWCVGHLAGLADADSYDPKYAKWRYDDLPILPEHWQMVVGKDKKKQFDILKKLMNAPDVTEVVNACDAGREGELIFRSVYELAGCQKPMKRLWISSMEDSAIREGFANLRPGADYDGLRDAALCRAKADWLVGINATRLFSVLYHRTLNIGRVMSPTLALIVQREAEIDTFKPVPFYTVALELPGLTVSGERMADKAAAEQLKEVCQGAAVTIKKVECKEKSEKPPALYDLTTLQRDANRLLGFTAQQTLDYLQSLYEKKLCTYPRTDSRYLTGDMADSLPVLVNLVANAMPFRKGIAITCDPQPVINDKKVTDHHAVIPTRNLKDADLSALPAGEKAVLELVALRLMCAVAQPHIYSETVVIADCAGGEFTAKGKTVKHPGWKALEDAYRAKMKDAEPKKEGAEKALPELTEGQTLSVSAAIVKEGKSSPPQHFTEAICCERGICFPFLDFRAADGHFVTNGNRRECLHVFVGFCRIIFLNQSFPSILHNSFAFGGKHGTATVQLNNCLCVSVRIANSYAQPIRDQLQNCKFTLGKFAQIAFLQFSGRNDGMVICDLFVIHNLLCMNWYVIHILHGECVESQLYEVGQAMCHIFRQKPAVGTGISDQFLFIEVLRVVQGLLCRVAKHTVGFSL